MRFANEWIRRTIRAQPRELLRMGTTMAQAAKAFEQVMGKEATQGISYPTERSGRREAGFTESEITLASELAQRVSQRASQQVDREQPKP